MTERMANYQENSKLRENTKLLIFGEIVYYQQKSDFFFVLLAAQQATAW
jgi:exonuclease VII large subunit